MAHMSPPEYPGISHCAKKGLNQDIFQQAGFKNISEKVVDGKLKCGTTDVCWNMMTEVAAPVVSALSKAGETLKEKIKSEVYQLVSA